MSDHPDDLGELRDLLRDRIEALAVELLGEHNKALSTRKTWRWGGKGSLAVELTGRKQGAWYSHEAGAGGGPLDLIRHAKGGGLASAMAWARNWIGKAEEAPRPPPRRPEPAADPERETAIADARRIWAASGPVAGTTAEKYLVSVRKIPAPPNGWPGTVVRWNASKSSLVLAATRADGTVQAIQRVRLGHDGRKADDGQPAKLSRGPQDGAMVRLPGDPAGPLLVAEGPETGLSAWRATGHETWVALGSMAKAELPTGRRVVICADDDPRRATKGKAATAAKTLRDAVARWKSAGVDLVVAYPWAIRRGDKSDFNDAMQAEGIEAVAARIESALHPTAPTIERVLVKRARERLAVAVAEFVERARGWVPPDKGANLPNLPPPVEMIRVDVGAGKSEAARRGLVRLVAELRAVRDRRNVAILVPTHALGEEQAAKIMALPEAQKARLTVRVWRGRKAADPEATGQTMCRDLEAVELAQSVALDPQSTVCRRKLRDGTVAACPFFTTCGYQRQRQAKADIWLAAHEMLFLQKQGAMGELAAVVVDEKFQRAGLVLSEQEKAGFPLDLLDAPATVPGDSLGTQRLESLHRLAFDVLRDHGNGPVLRERVLATGMTADSAVEAYKLEWLRKIEATDLPELVPGMGPEARKAAVAAAAGNAQVVRLAGFWHAMRALLAEGGAEESGWLTLDRADDGTRLVVMKGRRDVAAGWQVPTLILDAILRPELVRPFYPQARLVADITVATPHMRVRQVIDRAYSLAMLHPDTPEAAEARGATFNAEEAQRRKNRLRDLRVRIDAEARRVRRRGNLLVVTQKRIEEALLAMGLMPANVIFAHHNGIAGRDEWTTADGNTIKGADLAGLMLVGRTIPAPGSVGALAEALSGSHVPLLERWYQRTDATRETLAGAELAEADRHPDPLAEAIRWQICEGELVQIIGRGRGVTRTAANPLDVLVLCDVPLPLPVAETVTSASLDPTLPERMLAEGGAVFEVPADAARAYPGLFKNAEAAKKRFQRDRSGTFPYEGVLIGECPEPLARADYQVAGAGQRAAVAWFDPLVVPDPEAWLADRLGVLAWCRVAGPPATDPPAVELVPVVPGSMPDLVPEAVYPGRVLEPPPADMLLIGPRNRPLAMIEAPAMGPFMGARAVTSRGLGPWLLLARPPDDPLAQVPHPAFLTRNTPRASVCAS